jgi:hypothetical protein
MLFKITFTINLLLFATQFIIAQDSSRFYIQAGPGLSFTTPGGFWTEVYEKRDSSVTKTAKQGSLGRGGYFTAGIGYISRKNIGIELNGFYQEGINNNFRGSFYRNNYETAQYFQIRARAIYINPTILFRVPSGKIFFTGGIGFIKGWGKNLITVNETYPGKNKGLFEWEERGLSVTGFNSYAGADIPVARKITLSLLVNLTAASGKADYARRTKSEINGKSNMSDLTLSEKEITFKESLTVNNNPDPSKPAESLQAKANFNSLGIKLMLKFYL